MKQFLATDSVKLNDTFEKTTEVVEIVRGSGFVREGDKFKSWAQFQVAYGEAAGVSLRQRREVENYLGRIGLCFIQEGELFVIKTIDDEAGKLLYDFYLKNDEPAISTYTASWKNENRQKINDFLSKKPWLETEDRLSYAKYCLSRSTASALWLCKPETNLFIKEEVEVDVELPESSEWVVLKQYRVRGNIQPNRVDIQCSCGKIMKMYVAFALQRNIRCNSCAKRTTDFNAFYQSISDEKYTIVKDFQDARPTNRSRIVLQCSDPSHQPYSTFQHRWTNQGARCPSCSQNHVGEQKVREFLQSKNIPYKDGVCFDGLIGLGGGKLSYDFMIELNGENILLEIDGIGHFAPTAYGGRDEDTSEQAYLQQVEHDRRKTDFAVQKGLRLVRIQNVDANYDFILNSLEELLSGSTANHFGDLYQENESK